MTNEKGYLTVGLYERTFGAEASGDFTLPDYQSEIRRILHVGACVLPPAKYVGANSVDFSGTVDYLVMYVGMDGGVYTVPLSSEYSFNVPLERSDMDVDGVSVLCNVVHESATTRVSAPRRLSIRSRLRPNVRIFGNVPTIVQTQSEIDVQSVFNKSASCLSVDCESATSDVINLNCSVGAQSPDTRVVSADAKVAVTSQRLTENGITCNGRVVVKLLTTDDDTSFKTLYCEQGFEAQIDMQSQMQGASARVRGIITELSVNVGEEGISCDVGMILEAVVCANREVQYTEDVYSTKYECECHTERLSVRNMAVCSNANFTVSERIPMNTTSVPANAQIIDGMGSVSMDKCAMNGGKYVFSGNADFSVIYREEDGNINSADVTFPIRYECDGNGGAEPVSFDATVEPTDVKMKIADGALSVDAEMVMSVDCMGETIEQPVDKVSFTDAVETSESELIVCYPAEDDTLWSIAKRYKVPPTAVLGNPETDKYVMVE